MVYQKFANLDSIEENRQVDVDQIDTTPPLNLKKPEIPKYWNPSDGINGKRKKPTFLNCPGCGTQLKEKDINKRSCSYCGLKLDI